MKKKGMTPEDFLKLRRKLGYTQRQFGEQLQFGSPQPRVSEIERGVVEISPRIEALCNYILRDELRLKYGGTK